MNDEYYMTRPEEIAKHAELWRIKGRPDQTAGTLPLFEQMAAGDEDLFDALWSFWNFEHALDDLLDESPFDAARKELVMAALEESVSEALRELSVPSRKLPLSDFQQAWEQLIDRCGWSESRKLLAHQAKLLFFVTLIGNPLVRQHAGELRALFITAIFRCLDGDLMAKSEDARRRALAPAVRCGDVDVIIYLIFLARGFGAARVWGEWREYDLPDEETEQAAC